MPTSSRKPAPRSPLNQYRPLPSHGDAGHVPYGMATTAAPPYEPYTAHAHQEPPRWSYQPPVVGARQADTAAQAPTLPYFEAAIARSRGFGGTVPEVASQPLPSYAAPPDPNHPDLSVGLLQSNTIRYAMEHPRDGLLAGSRSPSPVREYFSTADNTIGPQNTLAADQPLLDSRVEDAAIRQPGAYGHWRSQSPNNQIWDERLSTLGLLNVDEGDLSLPPFRGASNQTTHQSPLPGADSKSDLALDSSDLAASTTQHFGPAPTGRVGRRTHNAAGGRRIRHTATLDENGFFAVDMPIPTRLAQFLPFKGVEEQKCTRYDAWLTKWNPVAYLMIDTLL